MDPFVSGLVPVNVLTTFNMDAVNLKKSKIKNLCWSL